MISKQRIALVIVFLVTLVFTVVAYIGMSSYGWFQSITHLTNSSEQMFAVRQGFNNDISTELNVGGSITLVDGDHVHKTIIPGETIYYSFVSRILVNEYEEAGIRDLVVSIDGLASALETHTANSGNYQNFLSHCMIEENSAILSILEVSNETESEALKTYTPVSYVNVDGVGSWSDEEGSFKSFSSTTTPQFTNSAVESLLDNNSFKADIIIHLPELSTYPIEEEIEDGETKYFINFVIYIPINYIDINEIQNDEMDSTIEISGCTVLPLINED